MAEKYLTEDDLKKMGFDEEPVFSITNAHQAQSVDISGRWQSYTIKMVIRLVCVIAAVFAHGWWQWVFLIGAGVLPWVAVVSANGQNKQPRSDFSAYLTPEQNRMLEAAQKPVAETANFAQEDGEGSADIQQQEPEIIEGEVIEGKI